MTNHDKFASAFREHAGRSLTVQEIFSMLLRKFPDFSPGSVLPSDHARGNAGGCWCAGTDAQIFTVEGRGRYIVRNFSASAARGPSFSAGPSRPWSVAAPPHISAPRPAGTLVIDDAFIREWHPRYDWTETDEPEYKRLVSEVGLDMRSTGTISQATFLAIWHWKGAMRVIGQVRLDVYDDLYAEAFRRAASEPPERKLAALLAPAVKLPGVGGPTGSTVTHFMHPEVMPIIDVRTAEVLFHAGLIRSTQTDLYRYEAFRQAFNRIRQRCPNWTLRQLDRALFAYHKQVLDTGHRRAC